jgi:sideroflexin-5
MLCSAFNPLLFFRTKA